MCGLCGVFGQVDTSIIAKMLTTLRHRGIDDEYSVNGDQFCLGVRRLSIVDVVGGRQPMSNEDGSVWVAQNGEIYNYKALRSILETYGHVFRSDSDTEVISHQYEKDGWSFCSALNGMFAIALWDSRENRGILVRDRVGEKPLYYTVLDDSLYFASEIKALLQIPNFKRRLNIEALHYYLSYGHIPCPLSIFQDINMLPPGHILLWQGDTKPNIRIIRYWKPDFHPNPYLTENDACEMLINTLQESVRRRFMSDVPVGFLLSGGLDSSLVVALAARISHKPINTYTLVYPDAVEGSGKTIDRDYARNIANQYGTCHIEEPLVAPIIPVELPKIMACFDEPFAGVNSTYFISKCISKHVKVAITGDGADELFGSYLSHRMAAAGQVGNDWEWRYRLLNFSDEQKKLLYSPDIVKETTKISTLEHLRQYFNGLTAQDPLNRMLEAEFMSIFPDRVLTFSDRLSMAHSLELRATYLDKDFIDLAASIPGSLKINNTTKYILKKAAKPYLPESIINRPKEGFIAPITWWLYKDLREYVEDTLSPLSLDKHGLFKSEYVHNLIEEFYQSEYDYRKGNKIIILIAFQIWYNEYMSGQAVCV